MNPAFSAPAAVPHSRQILHELGIPVHRVGFRLLCSALDQYSRNDRLSLTKHLYPAIAVQFGYRDWHAVEHAIRLVILQAWESQASHAWHIYFPYCCKAPSNKQFLATIAEYL